MYAAVDLALPSSCFVMSAYVGWNGPGRGQPGVGPAGEAGVGAQGPWGAQEPHPQAWGVRNKAGGSLFLIYVPACVEHNSLKSAPGIFYPVTIYPCIWEKVKHVMRELHIL